MTLYKVTLAADITVRTEIEVEADSEQEAEDKACEESLWADWEDPSDVVTPIDCYVEDVEEI